METLIETQALSKFYLVGNKANVVINDLNLSVRRGDFTVIMGSSGSGKTTLLNLLSGLDQISGGKVWINGIPLHNAGEKQLCSLRRTTIGFVFQGNNLIPTLTILDNILVAGYLLEQKRSKVVERALLLLKSLGISNVAGSYPSQVSGGEIQRASIARALINSPALLFADEPTGNLNSHATEKVLEAFMDLKKQGQSIVMVTHDLKAAACADRIIFLKDGTVIDSLAFANISISEREDVLYTWLKEKGW
jgi:putative ABC transport system ATP-binding protein